MQTIETTGVIAADHTLTVRLPDELPPGPCRVRVVIDDLPATEPDEPPFPYNLTVFEVGPWPAGFTASREQIYDEDDNAGR
jgi:hypothetical protein